MIYLHMAHVQMQGFRFSLTFLILIVFRLKIVMYFLCDSTIKSIGSNLSAHLIFYFLDLT